MHERVLVNYLLGHVSAEELAADAKDSQEKTSYDVTSVNVITIQEPGTFLVMKTHLIKLCQDCLSGILLPEDLNTIAFAINMSEYFKIDESDEAVVRVLFDWDNPEIGFPLTLPNMERWLNLLKTGIDDFNSRELRQKRRNGA
jgi:hypothetical protein